MKFFNTFLIATLFSIAGFFFTSCTDDDPDSTKPQDFRLSSSEIVFYEDGSPQILKITTDYDWKLANSQSLSWCEFSSYYGNGQEEVTITPRPMDQRTLRGPDSLFISYNNSSQKAFVVIRQEIDNTPPSVPALLSPEMDGYTGIYPTFRWEKSVDPEGDQVFYRVLLSEDNILFDTLANNVVATSYTTDSPLKQLHQYYWKIEAYDHLGESVVSESILFNTIGTDQYADGEYRVHAHSSKQGVKPVHLVFVGDGFIDEDYFEGAAFDQQVAQAVEYYFDLEPYTTYRDYFQIDKVAVYSAERGVSLNSPLSWAPDLPVGTKDTAFGTTLRGGSTTEINVNERAVLNAVNSVAELAKIHESELTIVMLINEDVYAGTCYMYPSGTSICLCPIGKDMRAIVTHESGGHGFGRLLDEYINNSGTTISPSYKQYHLEIRNGDPWWYAANIDFEGDRASTHWNHYFDLEGYESVGMYEGGALYSYGTWRPESLSIMDDNSQYFNAPSREAIVRRIMSIAGLEFDFETFLSLDVHNPQDFYGIRPTTAGLPPLAPPIMMR